MDMLNGPVTLYQDKDCTKEQLEEAISESLEQMREKYRQSIKNLEGYF